MTTKGLFPISAALSIIYVCLCCIYVPNVAIASCMVGVGLAICVIFSAITAEGRSHLFFNIFSQGIVYPTLFSTIFDQENWITFGISAIISIIVLVTAVSFHEQIVFSRKNN